MTKKNPLKILVIGAGIAGSAVCYWLRRFGFSPILIEKCAHVRKGGQAVDLRGVATELAKKMGIYQKIFALRTRIEVGRYVDALGNTLHEEKGERSGFRQGEDVEIIREDLVNILMHAIEGVPCHFNQLIESIEQSEEGVKVRFAEGREENYDLVVGTDGLYSTTRGMVFEKEEYKLLPLGIYLSVFDIPNYLHLSHEEMLCEEDQKLVTLTSDKDPAKAQAAFMFRSPNVLNNMRDENKKKEFLRETFQDFGWEVPKILELMAGSKDFYFDSATQVKMKSWTKGRVALLGDAGYCSSPLSGQGSNLALVGAYIFAGELKKAEGDYKRAFKRYHELLIPFVEANQQFGVWVSDSFLATGSTSKEVAEKRSNKILKEIEKVSNAIALPHYDDDEI